MAQYFSIHPTNPQKRLVRQAADIVRGGGLIASVKRRPDAELWQVTVGNRNVLPVRILGWLKDVRAS